MNKEDAFNLKSEHVTKTCETMFPAGYVILMDYDDNGNRKFNGKLFGKPQEKAAIIQAIMKMGEAGKMLLNLLNQNNEI